MTVENLGEYKDAHGKTYIVFSRTHVTTIIQKGRSIERPGSVDFITACGQDLNWTDNSPQEFKMLNSERIYKVTQ